MGEIAIKKHSFELAKKRLKEFSEKTEAELQINKVETDGGFLGLGDHKVTGYELNRRLEIIQEHFIAVNTTNNKVIKEFREIYNALNVLDKDYITSIVANVKAIEKTSNDVRVQQGTLKKHNEKLASQQSKLDVHQAEMEKNVENISKIVSALKVFKEQLQGYKHLTDIDKTWNECRNIQKEIRKVSDSITKFSKETREDIATANNKNKILSEQVNRDIVSLRSDVKSFKDFFSALSERLEDTANLLDAQILVIEDTVTFTEKLKNVAHLDDVDFMWNDLSIGQKNIEKINQRIQIQGMELNNLATTSDKHTDSILNLIKNLGNVEEHRSKLVECEKKDADLAETIQKNKEEVNETIAESSKVTNIAINDLRKRVKYAYWIAGGSAGLAVIEMILLLMKVI